MILHFFIGKHHQKPHDSSADLSPNPAQWHRTYVCFVEQIFSRYLQSSSTHTLRQTLTYITMSRSIISFWAKPTISMGILTNKCHFKWVSYTISYRFYWENPNIHHFHGKIPYFCGKTYDFSMALSTSGGEASTTPGRRRSPTGGAWRGPRRARRRRVWPRFWSGKMWVLFGVFFAWFWRDRPFLMGKSTGKLTVCYWTWPWK